MNLRNRLILIFLASTLLPLAATLWISSSLLKRSLSYATTAELDRLSRALEVTGREFYRQARERLKADALSGRIRPLEYHRGGGAAGLSPQLADFKDSGDAERFFLSGESGETLNYAVHAGSGVNVYSLSLKPVGMADISERYRRARRIVEDWSRRDIRRGFLVTFAVLSAGIWIAGLSLLVLSAFRVSKPIQRLTEGLSQLAQGNLNVRLAGEGDDEVGRAIRAFNATAEDLRRNRDRIIYLAQLASWQILARKMAHEVKNSLTPIRLNVEEIVARRDEADAEFIEQAAQIVVDEVTSLERRVRAFSEFAAEPPVHASNLDISGIVAERVRFLQLAHPDVEFRTRVAAAGEPLAFADEDLVRGILTNLIENGAQAAGGGGSVLVSVVAAGTEVAVEVHDSGPGLSAEARETLFEPAISFKPGGMGLGLSIVRKSALLSGGDIRVVAGELEGAGFRLTLPAAEAAVTRGATA